jgi:uncharacterized MnhB-related membrane protein
MVEVTGNTLIFKNLNWFGFCCLSLRGKINPDNLKIMIKAMKLQKGLIAIILGILALVAYLIMDANDVQMSKYVLEASGLFLMLGAFLFLYPILFARPDKEGCVELDSEVPLSKGPEGAEN